MDTDSATFVNLDEIRENVRYLLKHSSEKISELCRNSELSIRYYNLIQLINKSENSDLYSDIFSIVEEESKNIEVTSYGTIGSYFKGCITSTSFPGNPSCSLIC